MDAQGVWRCAPAFDLTFANAPEHALLVGSEGSNPTRKDMLSVARAVHIADDCTNILIDQVRDAVGNWLGHAKEAAVTPSLAQSIDRALSGIGDGSGNGAAFQFMQARKNGFGK